jgi:hypothetical protein
MHAEFPATATASLFLVTLPTVVAICLTGWLTSECAQPHQPDSVTLQGSWIGQEVRVNTQDPPTLVVEGTKLEFRGANSEEWYKATFSRRAGTGPKQLEAVVTDCPI